MSTNTSSATSLNFIGFDEMQGNGTSPILYNRIVILPPPGDRGQAGPPRRRVREALPREPLVALLVAPVVDLPARLQKGLLW